MIWIGILVSLVRCGWTQNSETSGQYPFSDDFLDLIANLSTTWKAGKNFESDMNLTSASYLTGVLPDEDLLSIPGLNKDDSDIQYEGPLPREFDAREKWFYCPTIGQIRDQGACGSCWAVAAVQVMSDRICIHSEGEVNTILSVQDLLTCCGRMCGFDCKGGYPSAAFVYWTTSGIVSGGEYGSKEGCKPYAVEECRHTGNATSLVGGCKRKPFNNTCTRTCISEFESSYGQDRHFGKQYYSLGKDEESIKRDLFKNGPVCASFSVYSDFYHYKSGVYQQTPAGKLVGGHAVKIIGWGEENDEPYWLVANSWNSRWGDKGFFKIRRGTNHVNIEHRIVTGIPIFKKNEENL